MRNNDGFPILSVTKEKKMTQEILQISILYQKTSKVILSSHRISEKRNEREVSI